MCFYLPHKIAAVVVIFDSDTLAKTCELARVAKNSPDDDGDLMAFAKIFLYHTKRKRESETSVCVCKKDEKIHMYTKNIYKCQK